LPVISTCIGAEGLEVSDQDNILLADTPQAFAMECRKLLEDPIFRRQIGEAGHALFQHRYTRARLATALERAYTAAQPVQAE
jgi:glycosyltransferase involved in cell wall biosynthesis